MRRPPAPRLALALPALLLLGGAARPALAHEVGLSRGTYALSSGVLTAELTFARREMIGLVAGLDENGDGALTAAEVARAQEAFAGAVAGRVKVQGEGGPCSPELLGAALADEDGVTVRARYRCAGPARSVKVDLALLEDLPSGHRHLARLDGNDGPSDALLSSRARSFTLSASAPRPGAVPAPAAMAPPSAAAAPQSPFVEGAARVLTHLDPPLFLLALALARSGRRSLLGAALAFTLASLVGLALAARGLFAPGPAVLGPALTLALAYVGADNLLKEPTEQPWRLALPFGLVQGFALALRPLAGIDPGAPSSLAGFALGAGLAELFLGALLIAGVIFVRARLSWSGLREKAPSALLFAFGLAWFLSFLLR